VTRGAEEIRRSRANARRELRENATDAREAVVGRTLEEADVVLNDEATRDEISLLT
jgi:hypothetical protein